MKVDLKNMAKVEGAIRKQLKIRLQTNDTPEFESILFHPYILILDAHDGHSVIGVEEKHHSGPESNLLTRVVLSSITYVEVLPVNFVVDREKLDSLELDDLDIIVSIGQR